MSESSRVKFNLFRNATDFRAYQPGQVIFSEGEVGLEMFCVKKGKIELRQGGRVLDTLEECEVFGEMALVDKMPRSATAVAVTEVEIVPIDERKFNFMVQQTPNFAITIVRMMALRLRRMDAGARD